MSLEQMTKELASYLRGWKSYFGFSQTPSVLRKLDEWIRRRLRSVIWKQWKHSKVRYDRLRRRNIGHALAAQTVGSPHGPWRLANSPALQSACLAARQQPFRGGTSRMNREIHVRLCERLGAKFPGPTRRRVGARPLPYAD
jgi:Group II intron, maturase-specific domain